MAKKTSKSSAPRSYASKADYPCTHCGGKHLVEAVSISPDKQSEFDCPDCGLHHVVSNTRFD